MAENPLGDLQKLWDWLQDIHNLDKLIAWLRTVPAIEELVKQPVIHAIVEALQNWFYQLFVDGAEAVKFLEDLAQECKNTATIIEPVSNECNSAVSGLKSLDSPAMDEFLKSFYSHVTYGVNPSAYAQSLSISYLPGMPKADPVIPQLSLQIRDTGPDLTELAYNLKQYLAALKAVDEKFLLDVMLTLAAIGVTFVFPEGVVGLVFSLFAKGGAEWAVAVLGSALGTAAIGAADGALMMAAFDLAGQVGVNLIKGDPAFNIDLGELAASFVGGLLAGGMTGLVGLKFKSLLKSPGTSPLVRRLIYGGMGAFAGTIADLTTQVYRYEFEGKAFDAQEAFKSAIFGGGLGMAADIFRPQTNRPTEPSANRPFDVFEVPNNISPDNQGHAFSVSAPSGWKFDPESLALTSGKKTISEPTLNILQDGRVVGTAKIESSPSIIEVGKGVAEDGRFLRLDYTQGPLAGKSLEYSIDGATLHSGRFEELRGTGINTDRYTAYLLKGDGASPLYQTETISGKGGKTVTFSAVDKSGSGGLKFVERLFKPAQDVAVNMETGSINYSTKALLSGYEVFPEGSTFAVNQIGTAHAATRPAAEGGNAELYVQRTTSRLEPVGTVERNPNTGRVGVTGSAEGVEVLQNKPVSLMSGAEIVIDGTLRFSVGTSGEVAVRSAVSESHWEATGVLDGSGTGSSVTSDSRSPWATTNRSYQEQPTSLTKWKSIKLQVGSKTIGPQNPVAFKGARTTEGSSALEIGRFEASDSAPTPGASPVEDGATNSSKKIIFLSERVGGSSSSVDPAKETATSPTPTTERPPLPIEGNPVEPVKTVPALPPNSDSGPAVKVPLLPRSPQTSTPPGNAGVVPPDRIEGSSPVGVKTPNAAVDVPSAPPKALAQSTPIDTSTPSKGVESPESIKTENPPPARGPQLRTQAQTSAMAPGPQSPVGDQPKIAPSGRPGRPGLRIQPRDSLVARETTPPAGARTVPPVSPIDTHRAPGTATTGERPNAADGTAGTAPGAPAVTRPAARTGPGDGAGVTIITDTPHLPEPPPGTPMAVPGESPHGRPGEVAVPGHETGLTIRPRKWGVKYVWHDGDLYQQFTMDGQAYYERQLTHNNPPLANPFNGVLMGVPDSNGWYHWIWPEKDGDGPPLLLKDVNGRRYVYIIDQDDWGKIQDEYRSGWFQDLPKDLKLSTKPHRLEEAEAWIAEAKLTIELQEPAYAEALRQLSVLSKSQGARTHKVPAKVLADAREKVNSLFNALTEGQAVLRKAEAEYRRLLKLESVRTLSRLGDQWYVLTYFDGVLAVLGPADVPDISKWISKEDLSAPGADLVARFKAVGIKAKVMPDPTGSGQVLILGEGHRYTVSRPDSSDPVEIIASLIALIDQQQDKGDPGRILLDLRSANNDAKVGAAILSLMNTSPDFAKGVVIIGDEANFYFNDAESLPRDLIRLPEQSGSSQLFRAAEQWKALDAELRLQKATAEELAKLSPPGVERLAHAKSGLRGEAERLLVALGWIGAVYAKVGAPEKRTGALGAWRKDAAALAEQVNAAVELLSSDGVKLGSDDRKLVEWINALADLQDADLHGVRDLIAGAMRQLADPSTGTSQQESALVFDQAHPSLGVPDDVLSAARRVLELLNPARAEAPAEAPAELRALANLIKAAHKTMPRARDLAALLEELADALEEKPDDAATRADLRGILEQITGRWRLANPSEVRAEAPHWMHHFHGHHGFDGKSASEHEKLAALSADADAINTQNTTRDTAEDGHAGSFIPSKRLHWLAFDLWRHLRRGTPDRGTVLRRANQIIQHLEVEPISELRDDLVRRMRDVHSALRANEFSADLLSGLTRILVEVAPDLPITQRLSVPGEPNSAPSRRVPVQPFKLDDPRNHRVAELVSGFSWKLGDTDFVTNKHVDRGSDSRTPALTPAEFAVVFGAMQDLLYSGSGLEYALVYYPATRSVEIVQGGPTSVTPPVDSVVLMHSHPYGWLNGITPSAGDFLTMLSGMYSHEYVMEHGTRRRGDQLIIWRFDRDGTYHRVLPSELANPRYLGVDDQPPTTEETRLHDAHVAVIGALRILEGLRTDPNGMSPLKRAIVDRALTLVIENAESIELSPTPAVAEARIPLSNRTPLSVADAQAIEGYLMAADRALVSALVTRAFALRLNVAERSALEVALEYLRWLATRRTSSTLIKKAVDEDASVAAQGMTAHRQPYHKQLVEWILSSLRIASRHLPADAEMRRLISAVEVDIRPDGRLPALLDTLRDSGPNALSGADEAAVQRAADLLTQLWSVVTGRRPSRRTVPDLSAELSVLRNLLEQNGPDGEFATALRALARRAAAESPGLPEEVVAVIADFAGAFDDGATDPAELRDWAVTQLDELGRLLRAPFAGLEVDTRQSPGANAAGLRALAVPAQPPASTSGPRSLADVRAEAEPLRTLDTSVEQAAGQIRRLAGGLAAVPVDAGQAVFRDDLVAEFRAILALVGVHGEAGLRTMLQRALATLADDDLHPPQVTGAVPPVLLAHDAAVPGPGYRSTFDDREALREFFGKGWSTEARQVRNSIQSLTEHIDHLSEEELARLQAVKALLSKIPIEDLVALRAYTATFYDPINSALRDGEQWDLRRWDPVIRCAASALSRLPVHQGTGRRGVGWLEPQDLARYRPGGIVTEPQFISAASHEWGQFGGDYTFVIDSFNGRLISAAAELPYEDELLFPPNTVFKVWAVVPPTGSNPEYTIYLQELPHGDTSTPPHQEFLDLLPPQSGQAADHPMSAEARVAEALRQLHPAWEVRTAGGGLVIKRPASEPKADLDGQGRPVEKFYEVYVATPDQNVNAVLNGVRALAGRVRGSAAAPVKVNVVIDITASDVHLNRLRQELKEYDAFGHIAYVWEPHNVRAGGGQLRPGEGFVPRDAEGAIGQSPSSMNVPGIDTMIPVGLAQWTPTWVKQWWDSLTGQEDMVLEHPDLIGGLDGIPAEVRDRANRVRLANLKRELAEGRLTVSKKILDGIRNLEERLAVPSSNEHPRPYLLQFGIDGPGQMVLAIGNPDTAANVATFVTGTAARLGDIGIKLDRMDAIANAAAKADPAATTAVIAWVGYRAPQTIVPEAMSGRFAEAAKGNLTRFQEGLRVTHQGARSRNVVIGYSYGSLVTGLAAKDTPLPVEAILFIASPGVGVDHANELNLTGVERHVVPGRVYATLGTNDIIWFASQHFGVAPTSQRFGGIKFISGPGKDQSWYKRIPNVAGHLGYFEDDEVLNKIGTIIVGDVSGKRGPAQPIPADAGKAIAGDGQQENRRPASVFEQDGRSALEAARASGLVEELRTLRDAEFAARVRSFLASLSEFTFDSRQRRLIDQIETFVLLMREDSLSRQLAWEAVQQLVDPSSGRPPKLRFQHGLDDDQHGTGGKWKPAREFEKSPADKALEFLNRIDPGNAARFEEELKRIEGDYRAEMEAVARLSQQIEQLKIGEQVEQFEQGVQAEEQSGKAQPTPEAILQELVQLRSQLNEAMRAEKADLDQQAAELEQAIGMSYEAVKQNVTDQYEAQNKPAVPSTRPVWGGDQVAPPNVPPPAEQPVSSVPAVTPTPQQLLTVAPGPRKLSPEASLEDLEHARDEQKARIAAMDQAKAVTDQQDAPLVSIVEALKLFQEIIDARGRHLNDGRASVADYEDRAVLLPLRHRLDYQDELRLRQALLDQWAENAAHDVEMADLVEHVAEQGRRKGRLSPELQAAVEEIFRDFPLLDELPASVVEGLPEALRGKLFDIRQFVIDALKIHEYVTRRGLAPLLETGTAGLQSSRRRHLADLDQRILDTRTNLVAQNTALDAARLAGEHAQASAVKAARDALAADLDDALKDRGRTDRLIRFFLRRNPHELSEELAAAEARATELRSLLEEARRGAEEMAITSLRESLNRTTDHIQWALAQRASYELAVRLAEVKAAMREARQAGNKSRMRAAKQQAHRLRAAIRALREVPEAVQAARSLLTRLGEVDIPLPRAAGAANAKQQKLENRQAKLEAALRNELEVLRGHGYPKGTGLLDAALAGDRDAVATVLDHQRLRRWIERKGTLLAGRAITTKPGRVRPLPVGTDDPVLRGVFRTTNKGIPRLAKYEFYEHQHEQAMGYEPTVHSLGMQLQEPHPTRAAMFKGKMERLKKKIPDMAAARSYGDHIVEVEDAQRPNMRKIRARLADADDPSWTPETIDVVAAHIEDLSTPRRVADAGDAFERAQRGSYVSALTDAIDALTELDRLIQNGAPEADVRAQRRRVATIRQGLRNWTVLGAEALPSYQSIDGTELLAKYLGKSDPRTWGAAFEVTEVPVNIPYMRHYTNRNIFVDAKNTGEIPDPVGKDLPIVSEIGDKEFIVREKGNENGEYWVVRPRRFQFMRIMSGPVTRGGLALGRIGGGLTTPLSMLGGVPVKIPVKWGHFTFLFQLPVGANVDLQYIPGLRRDFVVYDQVGREKVLIEHRARNGDLLDSWKIEKPATELKLVDDTLKTMQFYSKWGVQAQFIPMVAVLVGDPSVTDLDKLTTLMTFGFAADAQVTGEQTWQWDAKTGAFITHDWTLGGEILGGVFVGTGDHFGPIRVLPDVSAFLGWKPTPSTVLWNRVLTWDWKPHFEYVRDAILLKVPVLGKRIQNRIDAMNRLRYIGIAGQWAKDRRAYLLLEALKGNGRPSDDEGPQLLLPPSPGPKPKGPKGGVPQTPLSGSDVLRSLDPPSTLAQTPVQTPQAPVEETQVQARQVPAETPEPPDQTAQVATRPTTAVKPSPAVKAAGTAQVMERRYASAVGVFNADLPVVPATTQVTTFPGMPVAHTLETAARLLRDVRAAFTEGAALFGELRPEDLYATTPRGDLSERGPHTPWHTLADLRELGRRRSDLAALVRHLNELERAYRQVHEDHANLLDSVHTDQAGDTVAGQVERLRSSIARAEGLLNRLDGRLRPLRRVRQIARADEHRRAKARLLAELDELRGHHPALELVRAVARQAEEFDAAEAMAIQQINDAATYIMGEQGTHVPTRRALEAFARATRGRAHRQRLVDEADRWWQGESAAFRTDTEVRLGEVMRDAGFGEEEIKALLARLPLYEYTLARPYVRMDPAEQIAAYIEQVKAQLKELRAPIPGRGADERAADVRSAAALELRLRRLTAEERALNRQLSVEARFFQQYAAKWQVGELLDTIEQTLLRERATFAAGLHGLGGSREDLTVARDFPDFLTELLNEVRRHRDIIDAIEVGDDHAGGAKTVDGALRYTHEFVNWLARLVAEDLRPPAEAWLRAFGDGDLVLARRSRHELTGLLKKAHDQLSDYRFLREDFDIRLAPNHPAAENAARKRLQRTIDDVRQRTVAVDEAAAVSAGELRAALAQLAARRIASRSTGGRPPRARDAYLELEDAVRGAAEAIGRLTAMTKGLRELAGRFAIEGDRRPGGPLNLSAEQLPVFAERAAQDAARADARAEEAIKAASELTDKIQAALQSIGRADALPARGAVTPEAQEAAWQQVETAVAEVAEAAVQLDRTVMPAGLWAEATHGRAAGAVAQLAANLTGRADLTTAYARALKSTDRLLLPADVTEDWLLGAMGKHGPYDTSGSAAGLIGRLDATPYGKTVKALATQVAEADDQRIRALVGDPSSRSFDPARLVKAGKSDLEVTSERYLPPGVTTMHGWPAAAKASFGTPWQIRLLTDPIGVIKAITAGSRRQVEELSVVEQIIGPYRVRITEREVTEDRGSLLFPYLRSTGEDKLSWGPSDIVGLDGKLTAPTHGGRQDSLTWHLIPGRLDLSFSPLKYRLRYTTYLPQERHRWRETVHETTRISTAGEPAKTWRTVERGEVSYEHKLRTSFELKHMLRTYLELKLYLAPHPANRLFFPAAPLLAARFAVETAHAKALGRPGGLKGKTESELYLSARLPLIGEEITGIPVLGAWLSDFAQLRGFQVWWNWNDWGGLEQSVAHLLDRIRVHTPLINRLPMLKLAIKAPRSLGMRPPDLLAEAQRAIVNPGQFLTDRAEQEFVNPRRPTTSAHEYAAEHYSDAVERLRDVIEEAQKLAQSGKPEQLAVEMAPLTRAIVRYGDRVASANLATGGIDANMAARLSRLAALANAYADDLRGWLPSADRSDLQQRLADLLDQLARVVPPRSTRPYVVDALLDQPTSPPNSPATGTVAPPTASSAQPVESDPTPSVVPAPAKAVPVTPTNPEPEGAPAPAPAVPRPSDVPPVVAQRLQGEAKNQAEQARQRLADAVRDGDIGQDVADEILALVKEVEDFAGLASDHGLTDATDMPDAIAVVGSGPGGGGRSSVTTFLEELKTLPDEDFVVRVREFLSSLDESTAEKQRKLIERIEEFLGLITEDPVARRLAWEAFQQLVDPSSGRPPKMRAQHGLGGEWKSASEFEKSLEDPVGEQERLQLGQIRSELNEASQVPAGPNGEASQKIEQSSKAMSAPVQADLDPPVKRAPGHAVAQVVPAEDVEVIRREAAKFVGQARQRIAEALTNGSITQAQAAEMAGLIGQVERVVLNGPGAIPADVVRSHADAVGKLREHLDALPSPGRTLRTTSIESAGTRSAEKSTQAGGRLRTRAHRSSGPDDHPGHDLWSAKSPRGKITRRLADREPYDLSPPREIVPEAAPVEEPGRRAEAAVVLDPATGEELSWKIGDLDFVGQNPRPAMMPGTVPLVPAEWRRLIGGTGEGTGIVDLMYAEPGLEFAIAYHPPTDTEPATVAIMRGGPTDVLLPKGWHMLMHSHPYGKPLSIAPSPDDVLGVPETRYTHEFVIEHATPGSDEPPIVWRVDPFDPVTPFRRVLLDEIDNPRIPSEYLAAVAEVERLEQLRDVLEPAREAVDMIPADAPATAHAMARAIVANALDLLIGEDGHAPVSKDSVVRAAHARLAAGRALTEDDLTALRAHLDETVQRLPVAIAEARHRVRMTDPALRAAAGNGVHYLDLLLEGRTRSDLVLNAVDEDLAALADDPGRRGLHHDDFLANIRWAAKEALREFPATDDAREAAAALRRDLAAWKTLSSALRRLLREEQVTGAELASARRVRALLEWFVDQLRSDAPGTFATPRPHENRGQTPDEGDKPFQHDDAVDLRPQRPVNALAVDFNDQRNGRPATIRDVRVLGSRDFVTGEPFRRGAEVGTLPLTPAEWKWVLTAMLDRLYDNQGLEHAVLYHAATDTEPAKIAIASGGPAGITPPSGWLVLMHSHPYGQAAGNGPSIADFLALQRTPHSHTYLLEHASRDVGRPARIHIIRRDGTSDVVDQRQIEIPTIDAAYAEALFDAEHLDDAHTAINTALDELETRSPGTPVSGELSKVIRNALAYSTDVAPHELNAETLQRIRLGGSPEQADLPAIHEHLDAGLEVIHRAVNRNKLRLRLLDPARRTDTRNARAYLRWLVRREQLPPLLDDAVSIDRRTGKTVYHDLLKAMVWRAAKAAADDLSVDVVTAKLRDDLRGWSEHNLVLDTMRRAVPAEDVFIQGLLEALDAHDRMRDAAMAAADRAMTGEGDR